MRALALLVASAAVLFAAAPSTRAQDPTDESLPGHRALAWLAWRRAVWSHDASDYRRAVFDLEQDRARSGGSPLTDFMLAQALAQIREWKRAEAALEPAARALPDFPGITLVRAMLLTREKPPYQEQPGTGPAVAALDAFVSDVARYDRSEPLAAELRFLGHLERGCRLVALSENDRAFRDLEEALRLARVQGRPTSAEVLRILVQANLATGQGVVADGLAEAAMRQAPGEPTHYFVRAIVAAESGRMDDSYDWQLRAIQLKPDYPDPYAKLAYLAGDRGDLPTMRRRLETYESLMTDRWSAAGVAAPATEVANLRSGWGLYWLKRGYELANAGDLDGAQVHWRTARDSFLAAYQVHPGCVRAVRSLLEILSLLHAPEAEIEVWKKRVDALRGPDGSGEKGFRDTFC